MNSSQEKLKRLVELTLPWILLGVLLIYSYAKIFQHPYGFAWEGDGTIYAVFVNEEGPTLMENDRRVQIGPLTWNAFHNDLTKTFFKGVKPGTIVPVMVERDGKTVTIPWKLPGRNPGEVNEQIFSEWFLAYVFWMAGTVTFLSLRPKDDRWWLLSGFNFLTAIWLGAGGGTSNYHIWYSAVVLRMSIWLSVPIYLHLHWVFPRPLGKLPRPLVWAVYGIALALTIAQALQLFSQSLYFIGFLIAILGSLVLLIVHAIRQPDTRRDLRLLLATTILVMSVLIVLAVVGIFYEASSRLSAMMLLSFPLIPLGYLYAAYRRQLGSLEMRANRLVSLYFFIILMGIIGVPLLALADNALPSPDDTLLISSFAAISATLASIFGFPRFETFVEKRLLGVRLPPQNLIEIYSKRITSTIVLSNLLQLLKDDVLPSLLIRQFAFIEFENSSAKTLFASDLTEERVPDKKELEELLSWAGKYRPLESHQSETYAWVRLALPLSIGDDLIGIWLFGRHDPDDLYSQAEINVLQALANETAVALSNILQTERLKAMYKANIDRYEQERLRLSLELHDSVLNELAVLRLNINPDAIPENFQNSYETVTQRLREIVSDLRPPMLDYGLKDGLEEMAENLMERNRDAVNVTVNLNNSKQRYPADVEQHIFRIVQQACENALHHAKAKQVMISGILAPQTIQLKIEDDGGGFKITNGLELHNLLASKHFGLAGIVERAELINARVTIDSTPKAGTHIHVTWTSDQT